MTTQEERDPIVAKIVEGYMAQRSAKDPHWRERTFRARIELKKQVDERMAEAKRKGLGPPLFWGGVEDPDGLVRMGWPIYSDEVRTGA